MASGGSILCSLILHNPVLIIVSDNLLVLLYLGRVGKNYSSKEEEFLLPRTTSPKKIRRPHIRTSADVLQRNNPCESGSNGTAVVSSANAVISGLMIVSRTALIACLRALQHHNPTLARSRAA